MKFNELVEELREFVVKGTPIKQLNFVYDREDRESIVTVVTQDMKTHSYRVDEFIVFGAFVSNTVYVTGNLIYMGFLGDGTRITDIDYNEKTSSITLDLE